MKSSRWKTMQMHPFPKGTMVQTNEEYFEKFRRRVIGESIELENIPQNNQITIVKVIAQEGNAISEYQGMPVMMMSKDLENYLIN